MEKTKTNVVGGDTEHQTIKKHTSGPSTIANRPQLKPFHHDQVLPFIVLTSKVLITKGIVDKLGRTKLKNTCIIVKFHQINE
jgi:hypothetical protein